MQSRCGGAEGPNYKRTCKQKMAIEKRRFIWVRILNFRLIFPSNAVNSDVGWQGGPTNDAATPPEKHASQFAQQGVQPL